MSIEFRILNYGALLIAGYLASKEIDASMTC
jgi:hypothetical protein